MARTEVNIQSIRRWMAAAALAAAVSMPAAAIAQVVVVANGSPITVFDIEQRTKLITLSTRKTPSRQDVIKDLIDDRIKIAKARSYGLDVTEAEIDQAYANMAKNQHITPQQFTQLTERSGVSASTIKARIHAQLCWGQLIRGKFNASLEIGETDVSRALTARNDSSGDTVGYIYTLSPVMVVIAQGSSASVMESKRREAENLRSRFISCKEGLLFSRALRDVVVRESITRASSDLAPQLRTLLGNLELGHLTTPEVTPQGLQMFALCDKKETKTDSPLKHEVREELYSKRFDAESKKYLEEVRKQAMIEYK